ncbi:hypothetical protein MSPP1_001849 [Malassezia sp. CBS 17886]|nr:hypothetical protein MSPP1_001849 [Malassezia sp. CBS 17886]
MVLVSIIRATAQNALSRHQQRRRDVEAQPVPLESYPSVIHPIHPALASFHPGAPPARADVRPAPAHLALVGPHVADYRNEVPHPSRPPVTAATISDWIARDARDQPLSTLPLYVNVHANAVALSPAQPALMFLPDLVHLALPPATHALTFTYDCAAPRARIDLYAVGARRLVYDGLGDAPVVAAPADHAHAPPLGWRISSVDVEHGFGDAAALPVVVDCNWVRPPDACASFAVIMEALDEDGLPLAEPNLLTTYLTVENMEAPRIRSSAQTMTSCSQQLQLHELFGLHSRPSDVAADPLSLASGDGAECAICMTLAATTLLLPCTHALCFECAVRVRESVLKSRTHDRQHGRVPRLKYSCPICRGAIETMLALKAPM